MYILWCVIIGDSIVETINIMVVCRVCFPEYFRQEPLLVVAPGLCILLLSLSINLLADELRDRLDVRKDVMKNM